jgi:ATP-dependent Clp protease ATP-binding subunit ClpA
VWADLFFEVSWIYSNRERTASSQNSSMNQNGRLTKNLTTDQDVSRALGRRVIGQPAAALSIIPYVHMHQAGLAPEGRPVGVFLLLGPTGTGKTKTVEALAEVLHGSERNVLRIDCGEFQMEHEVAKLIGAPPGYLGHRETSPILTQQKLTAITSERCNLSIILFDEIEKAAPSMTRLLLGVLDKASLRLGDNSSVNFDKSLIFLTSNLGAREMMKEIVPGFGFESMVPRERSQLGSKLHAIGISAVQRRFSPEFVNRVDSVITYEPLSAPSLAEILDIQLAELQRHIYRRLGPRAFRIAVSKQARQHLLKCGTSDQYGARELKRTLHRQIVQPLAVLVTKGKVDPGDHVRIELGANRQTLRFRTYAADGRLSPAA